MDSDEEHFWFEFKCEFGALLEFWSEIEIYKENSKRTIKSLWKGERESLWFDQRFGCTPSWWTLGHEFGAILGLAYVEGCQDNWDRSWKLKLKLLALQTEKLTKYYLFIIALKLSQP